MNFDAAITAEDVFRIAATDDPERYKALAALYPINTLDDEYRFAHGERRVHRKRGGVTRHVPKEMRRSFTAEEWAETKAAMTAGKLEQDAIERSAAELAAEGMRGY